MSLVAVYRLQWYILLFSLAFVCASMVVAKGWLRQCDLSVT